jgi:hypothetical protein
MAGSDPIGPLVRWLADERAAINIAGQVTVRKTERGEGDWTRVAIDHLLLCPLPGYAGWRITTKKTFLPRAHFSSYATHSLRTADHERGRALYCMDHLLDDEVVAGMRYHVDKDLGWPVFVIGIAYRSDFRADVELRRRTVAGAFVLKQYVHAIADAIGRVSFIDIDVSKGDEEGARELGFRRAPKLKGLRVAGTHMRQQPLG